MRKKFAAVFALVVLIICFASPLSVLAASGPTVYSTDIDIELLNDGSARITEVWDVDISSGTEFYLGKLLDLDGQTLSGLVVKDETGRQFEDVGRWNSSIPAEEKTGKSGIMVNGETYELCWGNGGYGRHTYTISYTFTGFVQSYKGADGIYQYLVPQDMPQPQNLSVVIRYANNDLKVENTGIWVFGFTGDAKFTNGQIHINSTRQISSSEYAVVLVELATGMLNPTYSVNKNFEDVKKEAIDGSGYKQGDEKKSPAGNFMGVVSKLLPFIIVALIASFFTRKTAAASKKFQTPKISEVMYARELPFNNDIAATHYVLKDIKEAKDEGSIFGVFILRWMQIGLITIHVNEQAKRASDREYLVLNRPVQQMHPIEGELYSILQMAAGPDGVLESKEMESWGRKNYTRIESWFKNYSIFGESQLTAMGALSRQKVKVAGVIPMDVVKATPLGEELCVKMIGFKRYLVDFTIINERKAVEVALWKDYLVYAQLLGIADTVYAQFNQLYPAYFTQPQAYSTGGTHMYNYGMIMAMSRSFSTSAYTGYRSGYNASHSSYSGGGGGFSGGGGGGASGGGGGGSR